LACPQSLKSTNLVPDTKRCQSCGKGTFLCTDVLFSLN
jgi:hypothetical protein